MTCQRARCKWPRRINESTSVLFLKCGRRQKDQDPLIPPHATRGEARPVSVNAAPYDGSSACQIVYPLQRKRKTARPLVNYHLVLMALRAPPANPFPRPRRARAAPLSSLSQAGRARDGAGAAAVGPTSGRAQHFVPARPNFASAPSSHASPSIPVRRVLSRPARRRCVRLAVCSGTPAFKLRRP